LEQQQRESVNQIFRRAPKQIFRSTPFLNAGNLVA